MDNKSMIELRHASLDFSNYVAMANDMARGASELSLNEHKLMRFLLMQVKPADTEIVPVVIGAAEFCNMLGVTQKDAYRMMMSLARKLMREVIFIGDEYHKERKWQMLHWIDTCKYESGLLTIKLSDELKPYIINLKGWYEQYRLEEIIDFKSAYAIKIYELILSAIKSKHDIPHADVITDVYIDTKTLRKATGTENKLERIYVFREKVIDIAVRDINNTPRCPYHVTVEPDKVGRTYVGFLFHVESKVGYSHRTGEAIELPPLPQKPTLMVGNIGIIQEDEQSGQLSLDITETR